MVQLSEKGRQYVILIFSTWENFPVQKKKIQPSRVQDGLLPYALTAGGKFKVKKQHAAVDPLHNSNISDTTHTGGKKNRRAPCAFLFKDVCVTVVVDTTIRPRGCFRRKGHHACAVQQHTAGRNIPTIINSAVYKEKQALLGVNIFQFFFAEHMMEGCCTSTSVKHYIAPIGGKKLQSPYSSTQVGLPLCPSIISTKSGTQIPQGNYLIGS